MVPGSDDEILQAAETSHLSQFAYKWPDSVPWNPASSIFTRSSSAIAWVAFDKYYSHQAKRDVPAKGRRLYFKAVYISLTVDIPRSALA